MFYFSPYTLQECNKIYKELDLIWITSSRYLSSNFGNKLNYLFTIFLRVESTLCEGKNYRTLIGVLKRAIKEFKFNISFFKKDLKPIDLDLKAPSMGEILKEFDLHVKKYNSSEYPTLYVFLSHYSLYIEHLEKTHKNKVTEVINLSVLDIMTYFLKSRIRSLINRIRELPFDIETGTKGGEGC